MSVRPPSTRGACQSAIGVVNHHHLKSTCTQVGRTDPGLRASLFASASRVEFHPRPTSNNQSGASNPQPLPLIFAINVSDNILSFLGPLVLALKVAKYYGSSRTLRAPVAVSTGILEHGRNCVLAGVGWIDPIDPSSMLTPAFRLDWDSTRLCRNLVPSPCSYNLLRPNFTCPPILHEAGLCTTALLPPQPRLTHEERESTCADGFRHRHRMEGMSLLLWA